MDWYLTAIRKCTKLRGRSRRKEYWYFTLFNTIFYLGLGLIVAAIGSFQLTNFEPNLLLATITILFNLIYSLYSLGMIVTLFSVSVRRLHDIGKSAWWMLLYFLPLIGGIVLLIFYVQDSQPGKNQYGSNPKRTEA